MSNIEPILEVGIEGGSLRLSAQRLGSEWAEFSLYKVSMGLDADDNETWSSADFGPVKSWDEALNLLDDVTENWVIFYPVMIHPEFYDHFLVDAERRALNLGGSRYERWKKVCVPRWSELLQSSP